MNRMLLQHFIEKLFAEKKKMRMTGGEKEPGKIAKVI